MGKAIGRVIRFALLSFCSIVAISLILIGLSLLQLPAERGSIGSDLTGTAVTLLALGTGVASFLIFDLFFRKRSHPLAPVLSPLSDLERPATDTNFPGIGASIELGESHLVIRRAGAGSFFIHGMKGEKRIPYHSITAIQFKDATANISGYIQFSILGGAESRGGIWDASKDENTVLFSKQQMPSFQRLRIAVEAEVASRNLNARPHGGSSLADEIAKLALLHDQGVLSDVEFASSKAAAIAGKKGS